MSSAVVTKSETRMMAMVMLGFMVSVGRVGDDEESFGRWIAAGTLLTVLEVAWVWVACECGGGGS